MDDSRACRCGGIGQAQQPIELRYARGRGTPVRHRYSLHDSPAIRDRDGLQLAVAGAGAQAMIVRPTQALGPYDKAPASGLDAGALMTA
uniref:Nicotinate-nucleotide pyrophosphorylase n=1 Tax=Aureimonas frigidaquae TaxID=424757 RepID=A0A0P0Z004_9HYPH|nr:nicotinate-nucleotide pyrophosphorylase [Aureimonas frigidaquae]